ncbi:MAG: hypothetical protein PF487_03540 [Bacteroidales bacterium]|jgi:hypothetical protein|nr:hypothetical protein [Bacteroidales bacterium]
MIHKLNIKIDIELFGLSDKEYLKIQSVLAKKMIGDYVTNMSFNELNELFFLSKRKYLIKTIEYPEINHNELLIDETTIEIIG